MSTDDALLLLWDLVGRECEHGRGFEEQCPGTTSGLDGEPIACIFNDVRPALRAASSATPSLYLAVMESQHYSWHAIGHTEDEARDALAKVWDAHMERVADDSFGYGDVLPGAQAVEDYGANVYPIRLGVGLRDGAEIIDRED